MRDLKLVSAAALAAALLASPAFAQANGTAAGNAKASLQASKPALYAPNGAHVGTTPETPPVPSQAAMTGGSVNEPGGYTGAQILIQKDQTNKNAPKNAATAVPSKLNPVLAANGDARASKVIGTTVYNAQNKQLGSVNDILIGKNGIFAVVSANGNKMAVPFDQLQFGDSKVDGHEKVVIPDMTQAQLKQQQPVSYHTASDVGASSNVAATPASGSGGNATSHAATNQAGGKHSG